MVQEWSRNGPGMVQEWSRNCPGTRPSNIIYIFALVSMISYLGCTFLPFLQESLTGNLVRQLYWRNNSLRLQRLPISSGRVASLLLDKFREI